MIKAKLPYLVLVDTPLENATNIDEALVLHGQDILDATDKEVLSVWEKIDFDFTGAPWEEYSPGYKGPAISWVTNVVKDLPNKPFIQLVIDDSHWDSVVYGWNLGRFFSNSEGRSQVQVIKNWPTRQTPSLKKTFDMEIAHAFDNWIEYLEKDFGLFERLFGVTDFDEDVIHGRDQRYPVYQYKPVYAKIKEYLIKHFPNMVHHIIEDGTEQYLVGSNGKKFHIYNLATLQALKELGIVGDNPLVSNGSIPDSGKELVVLIKE